MKKVLILSSLLLLGFTSCKKVYQCSCTTTGTIYSNATNVSTSTSATTNTFSQKITLSDAKADCPPETIYLEISAGSGGGTISKTTTCELLK